MKKILCPLFVLFSSVINAQDVIPKFDQQEFGQEIVPSNLYLEATKNLCELKEIVNVTVHIIAANEKSVAPLTFNYDYKDPFDAPWKIGEFKILSGGARVVVADGCTAQLQMPSNMPKEKAVTVQVTLNPVVKKYQQVILFTTIYLEDNDNVFFFNCPFLGINNEKYVIKNNGGVFSKTDAVANKAAGNNKNSAAQQKAKEYAMKAAAADISGTEHGFDITTLTSNAKAIYAKENDITSILINDDRVEMINGKPAATKRMYSIAISIPGKSSGDFMIKTKKEIAVAITFPAIARACSCNDSPEEKQRREEAGESGPTCFGGTIQITSYNLKTKIIEGFLNAQLEGADPYSGAIFYGRLNGKFKITLAN